MNLRAPTTLLDVHTNLAHFFFACILSKYMSLKRMRVRVDLPRVLDLMNKSILTLILLESSHSRTHSVGST